MHYAPCTVFLFLLDFLSSSFITPLAADNKIHTIHIKYIKIEIKSLTKSCTVPAKTLHTASLTYTQKYLSTSLYHIYSL